MPTAAHHTSCALAGAERWVALEPKIGGSQPAPKTPVPRDGWPNFLSQTKRKWKLELYGKTKEEKLGISPEESPLV